MIIGFSGRLKSGKDTCAERLLSTYKFHRISFAEALKREVATKFNRTLRAHVRMTSPAIKKADDEGRMSEIAWESTIFKLLWIDRDEVSRAMLQEMGTDVRRADDPEYWIKKWEEAVDQVDTGHITVTDVRFQNELEAIRRRGGKLVRVERASLGALPLNPHPSETGCDYFKDWDAVLKNDGTIQDLWSKVDQMVLRWGIGLPGVKA